jgi:molecular chaperone DnaK
MHLGIDLGTLYSQVARVDAHGNPVLFPDQREAERFRTASVVHVGPDGALVGQAVEDLLEEMPCLRVARSVKQKLGSAEPVLIDHGGQAWLPEGIAALVLKKLRRDVQAYTDEPVESATISVPAHASDLQRRATLRAGALAGFTAVQLVEDPLAAAAHYGTRDAGADRTVLVYDLGGATFGATVLHVGRDGLVALATEGTSDLGGMNFDEAVMGFIADQFRMAHAYDPLQDPAAAGPLRRHAEALKIQVASSAPGVVRTGLLIGGRVQEIVLTRRQLDRIGAPLVERTIAVCEMALRAAGQTWDIVHQIVLAGNSTLLPAVEEAVRRASGKPADRVHRDQPHLAVAYGSALIAAQQAGQGSPGVCRLRRRITGVDLGFRVIDPVTRATTVDVVIPKNAPIPTCTTTTYFSNRADQKRIMVEVVQVPNSAAPPASLGHFAFLLEHPRKNHPLEVTLGYDEHGMVTVGARDPETNQGVKQDLGDLPQRDRMTVQNQAQLLHRTRLCE